MFLISTALRGSTLRVFLPEEQTQRLRNTCFRGPEKALAGNSLYSDIADILQDPEIRIQLLKQLEDLLIDILDGKVNSNGKTSFEVEHPRYSVGWASTGKLEDYPDEALETFLPSIRSQALRVKRGENYQASFTNILTFVMTYRPDDRGRNRYVAFLQSLYPGPDIGELTGNVSAREGIVFFTWEHPGVAPPKAPLPVHRMGISRRNSCGIFIVRNTIL